MTRDQLAAARAKATTPDFIQVFDDPITVEGPLSGLTVAVKDLFDVRGYATGAGTAPDPARPVAQDDAVAVARLRAAGAGLIGHANMTEYAYSGLGLNPHHGTPMTPLIKGAIAGGSTSGGASAVARGVADIALGTDTGGSARIPAAFCGIYGFKPTANTISRDGAVPLSHSLDSVGVMTSDPTLLRPVLNVLRDQPLTAASNIPGSVIVPRNFGLDDVDPQITDAFETALEVLEEGGITIRRLSMQFFETYRALPVWQFSAVESRCHHGEAYAKHRDRLDPRVASRMARAEETDAPGYARALLARQSLADQAARIFADAPIVLPTVAILPPQLADLDDDATYDRTNLLALRNTSLGNVIDGCSVSLPLSDLPGAGLMLTAPRGHDATILGMAEVLASEL